MSGFFYHGRHRKPTHTGRNAAAIAASGAFAIPALVTLTGTAHAGPAGGWGPIIDCESGGDPTAQNPSSSASGLFQFIDSTWESVGGSGSAKDASVDEQYRRAEILYDRAGTTPWSASRSCWEGRSGGPSRTEVQDAPRVREAAAPAVASVRPLTGGRITSTFGDGRNHDGIDIAAPIGTPVYSATAGEVISSGPASGFGLWVRVRADDGTVFVYGHIHRSLVSVGEQVEASQQIAEVGNRGRSTGPHLHFEVQQGGRAVNPASWLAAPVVGDEPDRDNGGEADEPDTIRPPELPPTDGLRAADGSGTYTCSPATLFYEACDRGDLGEVVAYPLYEGRHRLAEPVTEVVVAAATTSGKHRAAPPADLDRRDEQGRGCYVCDEARLGYAACNHDSLGETVEYPLFDKYR